MRSNEQRLQSAIRFHQNLLRSRVMSPADTADVQFTIDVLSSQLKIVQPAQVTKPFVSRPIITDVPVVGYNLVERFSNDELLAVRESMQSYWYTIATAQRSPLYDAYVYILAQVLNELSRRNINE